MFHEHIKIPHCKGEQILPNWMMVTIPIYMPLHIINVKTSLRSNQIWWCSMNTIKIPTHCKGEQILPNWMMDTINATSLTSSMSKQVLRSNQIFATKDPTSSWWTKENKLPTGWWLPIDTCNFTSSMSNKFEVKPDLCCKAPTTCKLTTRIYPTSTARRHTAHISSCIYCWCKWSPHGWYDIGNVYIKYMQTTLMKRSISPFSVCAYRETGKEFKNSQAWYGRRQWISSASAAPPHVIHLMFAFAHQASNSPPAPFFVLVEHNPTPPFNSSNNCNDQTPLDHTYNFNNPTPTPTPTPTVTFNPFNAFSNYPTPTPTVTFNAFNNNPTPTIHFSTFTTFNNNPTPTLALFLSTPSATIPLPLPLLQNTSM